MLGQKSDTSKKNASSTKNSDAELNKNKRGLVKGPKPLQRLKFYLDIKNHAVTSKLEEKIKELGGAVEFFLDREVTHVISDRPQCQNNSNIPASSPSTPRLRSVEASNTNDSPNTAFESPVTGRLRQKTRADAMLEKVRSQSTNKVRDPLQNAKLWGIPIWNVNKILSWLEKVSASITLASNKKKTVKVINISAPFLKFEPVTRNARPVYKTIKSWPTIDLDSSLGKPAFIIKSIGLDESEKNKSEKFEEKSEENLSKTNQVDPESTNDSRMTRKQRTRLSVRGAGKEQEIDKQALVGGFCEICHCEYREIAEHVRSEQHLNFIKNDANFLELDSLISAGANVEAFLRLNGTTGRDLNNYPLFCRRSLRKLNDKNSSPEKCNGSLDGYSPPVTRNKMPRTRGSQNSLSPAGSDPIHHLRSRGQIWLPNNLIGTTAEDEPFVNNKKERGKSASHLTDDESKNAKENESDKRPKRACPKTKRISADERLVADNKTYYKVEVMTTKLRSSGLGTRETTEVSRRVQTPIPEEEDDEEQGLVVKFKRVRRSELSVLNDEAENFMFPRKEDPSFSDLDTDEGPNTTKSPEKMESSDIRSTSESDMNSRSLRLRQEEHRDDESSVTSYETEIAPRRKRKRNDTFKSMSEEEQENSIDNFVSEIGLRRKNRRVYTEIDENLDDSSKDGSTVCESEGGRKKRRRTHAEMFITDNQRYYKFETPGSRLRYQGMLFSNIVPKSETPNKNNGECSEQKPEIEDTEDRPKMPKDDLKFSFEFLPKSEPWYQTFKRQDSGDIIYTCTSDPGYCTNFFLPYQLPFIIPIDPKLCISEYQKKKQLHQKQHKEKLAAEEALKLAEETPDVDEEEEEPTAGCSTTDGAPGGDTTSCTVPPETNASEQNKLMVGRKRKRKSRFLKMSQMLPRKSPRQHASTLAILSSLIHQRKKRKSNGDSDTSRASLPSIPEEEESLNETRLSEEEQLQQEQEEAQLSKAIDDILNIPLDDAMQEEETLESGVLDLDDVERIEIKHNQDCIELIENFDKEETNFSPLARRRGRRGRLPKALFFTKYVTPSPIAATPMNNTTGGSKSVRRKRKKNRTGWPKKKRLFPTKKAEINKEDEDGEEENETVHNVELDDSRLTEISMEGENGEVEMCEEQKQNNKSVNNECVNRTIGEEQVHEHEHDEHEHEHDEHEHEHEHEQEQGQEQIENNKESDQQIQGVSSFTERINNVNNCNNKTNNVLGENLNNNSVSDGCDDKETILNSETTRNGVVVVNNLLLNNKITSSSENDVTVTAVPEDDNHKEHSNNTMIKVSVSTDFSSNKVPASPKKSDTVYSVTILDCKKSVVVDGKKVDSCEEVGVKDNWDTTERVVHYQPFSGRVQKNDAASALQNANANRRLRSSSSPSPERKPKVKKAKIVPPTSPRSPRKLRAPRGKWYRER